ncbi:diguanylate cyclase [Allohahella marinimesophila]|uniref:diguanylate cyclase n=1 Tax=Allohahella marinimesophila TaxID=1054972 RepID=A0ABP7QBI3_9GAMM
MFILLELGLIPANAMTLNAFQVGIAFEVFILSIGLAFRLQTQWQARAAAEREALGRLNQSQLETIEAQKQTRVELELHVRERTQALEHTMAELADANRELKLLSTTDELTGLSNRRSINATLQREWGRSERQGMALSVLLLDLDHFKAVNDQYGHPFGDQALREVAKLLTSVVQRPTDLVGRWGGEEFIILLADTTAQSAVAVAERIRELVAKTVISHEAVSINLSMSIGVAATLPANVQTGYRTPDLLVDAADRALYLAKQNGRNRVELMNEHEAPGVSTDLARSRD